MAKRRKDKPMQVREAERIGRVVSERQRVGKITATAERLAKVGLDGIEHADKGRVQRVLQAPLDRLWRAGEITQREFEAGDKLRGIAYLAAIDPAAGTVDWNAAGGGGWSGKVPTVFSSQVIYDARRAWRQYEADIRGVVRTVLDLALIRELSLVEIGRSVFGRKDAREAAVAGHAGFRTALGAAADWIVRPAA